MREVEIEKELVREVRKAGGWAFKFVSPGRCGIPDRIVVLPEGRVCFVELKAPKEKPRASQKVVMRRLCRLKVPVVTIDNKKTAGRLAEFLERRQAHGKRTGNTDSTAEWSEGHI